MNSTIKARLGIGPMSSEIIESVFMVSEEEKDQIMLIASKNQIDYNGGYVNNWSTKEYMDFLREMQIKYPKSDVLTCRDHCGPGFNGVYDLEDTYKTIREDIANGFDLIHVDFCHHKGSREAKLEESKKAIEYALKLKPSILFEIGTDENTGANLGEEDLSRIKKDVEFFKKFCEPSFYVVQTGSLVKENYQAGRFNLSFVRKSYEMLNAAGLKLKEHNADYLQNEEIEKRNGIVDAMNVAPQLGVIQTMTAIEQSEIYGIDSDRFLQKSYEGGKWKKWLSRSTADDRTLCSLVAGHYHFSSPEYKELIEQLERVTEIREIIKNNVCTCIRRYGNHR